MKLCLNLGCGKDFIESTDTERWINIDIVESFKADLYRNLRHPLPYLDGTVDFIKAKDILEHFTRDEIPDVFRNWAKVLKPGGVIEVIVPNIDAIKDFKGDTLLNLIFGERKFAGVDTGIYGLHKYCFTSESLRILFETNDLDVEFMRTKDGTNLHCKGVKQ